MGRPRRHKDAAAVRLQVFVHPDTRDRLQRLAAGRPLGAVLDEAYRLAAPPEQPSLTLQEGDRIVYTYEGPLSPPCVAVPCPPMEEVQLGPVQYVDVTVPAGARAVERSIAAAPTRTHRWQPHPTLGRRCAACLQPRATAARTCPGAPS
jgi:hypothetical protein